MIIAIAAAGFVFGLIGMALGLKTWHVLDKVYGVVVVENDDAEYDVPEWMRK